jgi:hypothetical protein
MGFLEKVIPGYRGYREREDSRNSDKLLRELLSNKLKEVRSRYDDIKAEIADRGALDLLKPAEKVTQTLSRVIDRLRYANYGFSGRWLGKDKIGIEQLDKVHKFDQDLAENVDQLSNDIKAISSAAENSEIESSLKGLINSIRDMDEALNDREQILRTFGGDKE